MSERKLAANEYIKTGSNFLRGTIAEGLLDQTTGALPEDDTQLTKFHGFYQQDDRDIRSERKAQKLEPLYSFMLRARIPGGVVSPEQWLILDDIAQTMTSGHVRLTTRQTFQYHGILKRDLKPLIQGLHKGLMDSIAACGDVNRNVMCNPNPIESELHAEAYEYSKAISEHLLPKTRAFAELWLDEEKQGVDVEPMYGPTYLPRKFKIAVAVPPDNDVDVYTNDIGFVAIAEAGKLVGFNITVGGGMGTTHGDKATYPRLGDELGYIPKEKALDVAEAILTTQRDNGNRFDRKNARLKYTVDTMGIEAFRAEVAKRAGLEFAPHKPIAWTTRGDRYGWVKGTEGKWHLTLFVENGRIHDVPGKPLQTGMREIAKVHTGDIRMTSNQGLIIANVEEKNKAQIEALAGEHGLLADGKSLLRKYAIACVSMPTCALGMAEAERYMPTLITKVDELLTKHKLEDAPIVMRMTGCPNGCARPFAAEIGFVGKGPGKYNFYLGACHVGTRLNKMYLENVGEDTILSELDVLFARYAAERNEGEYFGDFVVRVGVIKAVNEGKNFHD